LEYATCADNNSPLHPSRLPSAQERLACAGIVLPAARPSIANFVGGCSGRSLVSARIRSCDTGGQKAWEDWTRRDCGGGIRPRSSARAQPFIANALYTWVAGRVSRIVNVLGMVNVADDFLNHPAVINGCSDLLVEVCGETGRHARSAIGVASLPGGITVEGPPDLDRSFAFDVLRLWNLHQGRKNG
jgi:YjgF/chorismate_mutase-like, putative endoribonuclease